MRWDEFFADLEHQMSVELRQVRDAEAADFTRGHWAETSFADRLRGHRGETVQMTFADGEHQWLTISSVGPDWIGGRTQSGAVVIPQRAIAGLEAETRTARPPESTLRSGPRLTSVLRQLARRREPVSITAGWGRIYVEGTVDRVGRDYCEVAIHARDEFRRRPAVRGLRLIPVDQIQLIATSAVALDDR
ncbi:hypothetical protein [Auritidibacter ignavus]|uniref:hypothetical protein n=1 Tax=Auritidibacter ignavus TaxID=678932 RepID=UPI00109CAB3D|nr:hypothetical protein [Auritidibacter ignavus]